MGDGDDNARKRRREKLKDMQQRIDVIIFLFYNAKNIFLWAFNFKHF